jgi:hypothetical protein
VGLWAVLAVKTDSRRTCLAALMDWQGAHPPTSEAIAGHRVAAQGWAHGLTIQKNGGKLLGERSLGLDRIRGLLEVSHRMGGTVILYEGATGLRPASHEEAATLPVLETWGFRYVTRLAERLLIQHRPVPPDAHGGV